MKSKPVPGTPIGAASKETRTANKAARAAVKKKKKLPPGTSHAVLVAAGQIAHKSTTKNPCQTVWEICEQNRDKKRKEVLDACLAAGVAYYTARTQYQAWKAAGKASQK
jgi:hypothetical protein